MKRSIILFILLTVLTSISTEAQIDIGIISGVNLSTATQRNIDVLDINGKTLLSIGAVADICLFDNLSLQIEPMYVQKGSKMTPIDINESEYSLSASYIELPVLLKYSYGTTFRPYVTAGAALSFTLSSELETEIGGVNFTGDLKNVTEKIEYSLTFGGGVEYSLDPVTIFVEGRYSYSLNDLINSGEYSLTSGQYSFPGEIEDNVAYKNKGWQILAGVTIPLSVL
ncbi:porin family protein [Bacteroidota bacterium]